MPDTLFVGDDGANTVAGGAGDDLIYGFDPNGPQANVSSTAATRVAAGLAQPVFVGAPPGDLERLFIVEKGGRIKILDLASGQVLATPFLDVSGQITASNESGLLGLAFHPDFATNGFFYVNLVNTSGDTEIRRYQVSSDPNRADPASSALVIRIDRLTGSSITRRAGSASVRMDIFTYRSATAAAQTIRTMRARTSTRSSESCCGST